MLIQFGWTDLLPWKTPCGRPNTNFYGVNHNCIFCTVYVSLLRHSFSENGRLNTRIYNLMFVRCIAGLRIKTNTVHWVTSIYVYCCAAPTCFGTYVPSSESVFVLVSFSFHETHEDKDALWGWHVGAETCRSRIAINIYGRNQVHSVGFYTSPEFMFQTLITAYSKLISHRNGRLKESNTTRKPHSYILFSLLFNNRRTTGLKYGARPHIDTSADRSQCVYVLGLGKFPVKNQQFYCECDGIVTRLV
jgi:hypothetical protein